MKNGTLTIKVKQGLTGYQWEELEDLLKLFMQTVNITSTIKSSATGNEMTIIKESKHA